MQGLLALPSHSGCAELSLDHVRIAEVGTRFGTRFWSRTGHEARARDYIGPDGRTVHHATDAPRLPRIDRAAIPTEKLVGYALDPSHPRGRHKARVFSAALAIDRADWRYLHEQLTGGVVDAPVRWNAHHAVRRAV